MNRTERLMNEYSNIRYIISSELPLKLAGIIIQNTIYLNANESAQRLYSTLAEELGHWETSSNKDITNYGENGKDELRAREWSYQKIIPLDDFNKFNGVDPITDYYISDELDLPVDVVQEAFEMYKRKGVL